MDMIYTLDPQSFLEQILFSTLRLELIDDDGKITGIGTGFLVRADIQDNPQQALVLLISNRHVFENSNNLKIIFNTKDINSSLPKLGQVKTFIINNLQTAIMSHPNPKIDLACINLSLIFRFSQMGPDLYFRFIDNRFFAKFTEPELDIGQRVVFIGYPENRYDQLHNLPVLRSGVTASHPKLNYNGEEQFLIDAQVFPGSSGSPVFLNMKEAQLNRGQIILGSGVPYLFIGVVSATMIRNNIISPMPTGFLGMAQEVIGLGLVFKATLLTELIKLAVQKVMPQ